MSWFRKENEWDDWEIESENEYKSWEEFEEDLFQEEEEVPYGKLALIIGIILYACFLLFGVFSTDYENGRGYIVHQELREERAYIDSIKPFYEVLQRTPQAVETLEKKSTNTIDLIYQLSQLQDTISTFSTDIKTKKAPYVFEPFTSYLTQLAEQEVMFLQLAIAYYQDPTDARRKEIQETKEIIGKQLDNAASQMEDIHERLKRNQQ